MKRINLLLVMLFVGSMLYGQVDFKFGAKGGLNISNLTSLEDSSVKNAGGLDDPSSRYGFHAGLTAETKLGGLLGLGAELLYSQQGTKTESVILGIKSSQSFKLDYLTIPVLAKLYLGGLNVYAGIQPGFVVGAKQVYTLNENETVINLKEDSDNNNQFALVKEIDFGIPVGLGYQFDSGLNIDVRYVLGTLAVFENADDNSDYSLKNRVFQVSLGYTL